MSEVAESTPNQLVEEQPIPIIVTGNLTLDDLYYWPDRPPLLDTPGGNGMYALSGAWMGGSDRIGFMIRRGYDYDLSWLASLASRLDITGVRDVDGPSIHLLCIFDRKGHRYHIPQKWGGFSEGMTVTPSEIPARYMAEGEVFLFAPLEVSCVEKLVAAVPAGKSILLDPTYTSTAAQDGDRWPGILNKVDVFLPSELEVSNLCEVKEFSELDAYIPHLRRLAAMGPKVVVAKVGARGSLVYERETDICWHIPTAATKVVDVTGCGDTFCGAFAACWYRTKDAFASALNGAVAASFNIEHFTMRESFSLSPGVFAERLAAYSAPLNREVCRIS